MKHHSTAVPCVLIDSAQNEYSNDLYFQLLPPPIYITGSQKCYCSVNYLNRLSFNISLFKKLLFLYSCYNLSQVKQVKRHQGWR